MSDARPIEISVVLPCFNEEDCVERLTTEIAGVLDGLAVRYEILYIDDRSTDGTLAALGRAQIQHPEVRVIRHSVNCGESAATATGFRHARGSIVITMDSDEQNDPADIPRLLEALRGSDCVATKRRRREDDFVKRMSSKIGNGFRNGVTGVPGVSDAGCTYRALRRDALREVLVFNGMHRFLPTILRLQGFRVTEIEVNHRPRTTGASKYGIGNRMWRGIADCFAIRWYRKRVFPAARVVPEDV
ncbi:MAG: glycosyltransferase family 2 protein [Planctomycetes bacterium]|nr:glycosyltransferase family 2 protein [Planctomycetota bacterium]